MMLTLIVVNLPYNLVRVTTILPTSLKANVNGPHGSPGRHRKDFSWDSSPQIALMLDALENASYQYKMGSAFHVASD